MREYVKTHKGIDILFDRESEYYFLSTEPFPFMTIFDAVLFINTVTPRLVEKDGKRIEVDDNISIQEHLGYQLN